jgi:hypothetical protein
MLAAPSGFTRIHTRVGDVGIDLVGVTAQPVEFGPGRLERRVERTEVDLLRRVHARRDDVDGGGAGKHRGVEPAAVVEQVALQRERAHAVAEDDEREARVLAAGDPAQLAEIAHQAGPAAGTEVAVVISRPGRAAVTAVVVRVDHVAGGGQGFGQPPVAGGVLTHAVRELHDRSGRRVARPAVCLDLGAIVRIE